MRMRSVSVSTHPVFKSSLENSIDDIAIAQSARPLPMATSSSGIVIPNERTHKQKNYAFCCNPACAEEGQEFRFEIENTLSPCPKCGAYEAPMVGILAKVHLLVTDRNGPIKGQGGIRYRIACDHTGKRNYISTETNHELATGDRKTANCLDCLKVASPELVGLTIS